MNSRLYYIGLFYTPPIVEHFARYLIEEEFEGFEDFEDDDEYNTILDRWLDNIRCDTDEYLYHKEKTNDMALMKYIADNDSFGFMDCLMEYINDRTMNIIECSIKLRSFALYTVIREELQQEIEDMFNEMKKEEE
tara:strand:+ start:596 stop:1000 length:405 start_codon:yes stop_codon:yes gene_type:complete